MNLWRCIKRNIKHWWQRRTRGFDDSELWNLDSSMARWLAPRLRAFIPTIMGCPDDFCYDADGNDIGPDAGTKKWEYAVGEMAYAMEQLVEDSWNSFGDSPEAIRTRQGIEYFTKHFQGLWT